MLLQVDELAALWVQGGPVGLMPQIPALLDRQQPGIGELVVLEPLVLWGQVGVARASPLNAVLDWLSCVQQSCANTRHSNGQDGQQPRCLAPMHGTLLASRPSLEPGNVRLSCIHGPDVVDPLGPQAARLGGDGVEGEVGVGRYGRVPVCPKHLLAVVGAGKGMENVAWYQAPLGVTAIASLHGMREQRLDLDDFSLLDRRGDAHAWLCYRVPSVALGLLDAGAERHDNVRSCRPHCTIVHLGQGQHGL